MKRKRSLATFALICGGLLILSLAWGFSQMIFVNIDPGERGVLFRPFGGGVNLKKPPSSPGLHVIAPWNSIIVYDVKGQVLAKSCRATGRLNRNLHVKFKVRYHPIPDSLAYFYQKIGKNYRAKILIPKLCSSARKILSGYRGKKLQNHKPEVRKRIKQELRKDLQS
ncbi:MAG: SPFH domain-containing protein, partial [Flavobacteriales bacterium]